MFGSVVQPLALGLCYFSDVSLSSKLCTKISHSLLLWNFRPTSSSLAKASPCRRSKFYSLGERKFFSSVEVDLVEILSISKDDTLGAASDRQQLADCSTCKREHERPASVEQDDKAKVQ